LQNVYHHLQQIEVISIGETIIKEIIFLVVLIQRYATFTKNIFPFHGTQTKAKDQMKKALISGITGQDGAYLAEFLLKIRI